MLVILQMANQIGGFGLFNVQCSMVELCLMVDHSTVIVASIVEGKDKLTNRSTLTLLPKAH